MVGRVLSASRFPPLLRVVVTVVVLVGFQRAPPGDSGFVRPAVLATRPSLCVALEPGAAAQSEPWPVNTITHTVNVTMIATSSHIGIRRPP